MQIKVSDTLGDKITKISKKLDMPKTQVINMLVNDYLKENKWQVVKKDD